MLKGIDIRQRIEFVSSQDTSEPKTVFVLRPLSSIEMMEFSSSSEKGNIAAMKFYLENSIVEVKNFLTENIEDAICSIDPMTLGEMITELNKINHITGDETKNS